MKICCMYSQTLIPVLNPCNLLSAHSDSDGDDKCHPLFPCVTHVLVEFSEQLYLSQMTKRQRVWVPISAGERAYPVHLPGSPTRLVELHNLSKLSFLVCKRSLRVIPKVVRKSQ